MNFPIIMKHKYVITKTEEVIYSGYSIHDSQESMINKEMSISKYLCKKYNKKEVGEIVNHTEWIPYQPNLSLGH